MPAEPPAILHNAHNKHKTQNKGTILVRELETHSFHWVHWCVCIDADKKAETQLDSGVKQYYYNHAHFSL